MTDDRGMDMNEAAERIGISRRLLQDWLRGHPMDAQGEPFYSPFGRRKTFTDSDIDRIRAAAKRDLACRSLSASSEEVRRRTTPSAAPTSESTLKQLRALLTKSSPARSCATSSPPSNVVSISTAKRNR